MFSYRRMVVIGGVGFDLEDVKRFHTYSKHKQYHLYIKFKENDDITIHFDNKAMCDEAFKTLRQSFGLYTKEEEAENAKKLAEEAAKKPKEKQQKPSLFTASYVPTNVEEINK